MHKFMCAQDGSMPGRPASIIFSSWACTWRLQPHISGSRSRNALSEDCLRLLLSQTPGKKSSNAIAKHVQKDDLSTIYQTISMHHYDIMTCLVIVLLYIRILDLSICQSGTPEKQCEHLR